MLTAPIQNSFLGTAPSPVQAICIAAATYGAFKYIEAKRSPLNAIPTIGYSGILMSYITAIQWFFKGPELIREGYEKYPHRVFKIATISKWVVVLNGRQHVDDIRLASNDVLSFIEAVEEVTHTKYVLGPVDQHPHHEVTIRSNVTRNIGIKSDEMVDEITTSLQEFIPISEDWVTITAVPTLQRIICRSINRYFVGLPLCRDRGFCDVIEKYVVDVVISGKIIGCFPELFRPLVGDFLTPVARTMKQAMSYLGPTVEERIARYEQYGKDDPDRPNDLISWFLDTATEDYHRTSRDIINRVLLLNFAAIHTTSMTLISALFNLAIHPEYLDDLREEVEATIQEHGWTKVAMQKLRKLDSFMKEAMRVHPFSSLTLMRKTIKDWTTSDGIMIPAGSFIGVPNAAMAQSKDNFEDPDVFKGFRFAEMRDGEGQLDSIKHQMVSLEYDHIIFGHGRHACPGRFFAVHDMKMILAQILLNYDVQFENGSKDRPTPLVVEQMEIPNPKAKMRFRKRKVDC